MRPRLCDYCGQSFISKKRNAKQRFCSKSCAGKGNLNTGRFQKGISTWNKGLLGYRQGHEVTQETKEKIRLANSGENAPNWQGGISTKNELIRKSHHWQDWRKAVFERDNYTCQDCGNHNGIGNHIVLHPHHIKSLSEYPELAYDITNGITLCKECHNKRHSGSLIQNFTGKKAVKIAQD